MMKGYETLKMDAASRAASQEAFQARRIAKQNIWEALRVLRPWAVVLGYGTSAGIYLSLFFVDRGALSITQLVVVTIGCAVAIPLPVWALEFFGIVLLHPEMFKTQSEG